MKLKIFLYCIVFTIVSQPVFSQSVSFQKMLYHFTKSTEYCKKGLTESYFYYETSTKYYDSSKACYNKIQANLSAKNRDEMTSAYASLQTIFKNKGAISTDAKKKFAANLSLSLINIKVKDVGYDVYSSSKGFILKILDPKVAIDSNEDRQDILVVSLILSNNSEKKIAHLMGDLTFYCIYEGRSYALNYKSKVDMVINLEPHQSYTFIREIQKFSFDGEVNYKSMTSDFLTCLLVPKQISYADDTFVKYTYFPLLYSEKYYNLDAIAEEKTKQQGMSQIK